MTPAPHFVHRIDPILVDLGGIRLWYYGLAYAVGFLGAHLWLRARRDRLGWRPEEVYDFSIFLAISILLVGHAFEIVFYEWAYYSRHPWQTLNYWNGGMSTHGVLLGAALGTWAFCRLRGRGFLALADELAIPAAFFMGVGRLGNFINGENYGPIAEVWWAVKFPYAEGFRHPVDLYDALKNFGVLCILLAVRKAGARARGMLLAHFVFWYGFLRLAIDLFREYGADFLGIGRGQYFNLAMALTGLALMLWSARRSHGPRSAEVGMGALPLRSPRLWGRKAAFVSILLFSLTIPSGWSQGWLAELKAYHAPHHTSTSGAPR